MGPSCPKPRLRGAPGRAAMLAGVLAVLLGACGVSTDSAPHPIARSKVPFHLLDPTASSTPAVAPAANVIVYFVDPSQHLVAVERAVTQPGRLLSVMDALVAGPTSTEQINQGISSAITPAVRVLSATTAADGVATIDFNSAFVQIGSSSQVMAVAQVVYTATQQPGVTGVEIEVNDAPIDVPVASNAEVRRPVTRSDYAPEAPLASPPVP